MEIGKVASDVVKIVTQHEAGEALTIAHSGYADERAGLDRSDDRTSEPTERERGFQGHFEEHVDGAVLVTAARASDPGTPKTPSSPNSRSCDSLKCTGPVHTSRNLSLVDVFASYWQAHSFSSRYVSPILSLGGAAVHLLCAGTLDCVV